VFLPRKEERMKTTIPPATKFEFEKVATLVCDIADFDHTEKSLKSYELQNYLQRLYLDGLDLNLSSEQAQQRAINLFGDPIACGRAYRNNDVKDIFLYDKYRLLRLIVLIGICFSFAMFSYGLDYKKSFFDMFYDGVTKFPRFFANGLLTIALLYIVLNLKKFGLFLCDDFQAVLHPWLLEKAQKSAPRSRYVWSFALKLCGFAYRPASTSVKLMLTLLSVIGFLEIMYLTRPFLLDYFISPHAAVLRYPDLPFPETHVLYVNLLHFISIVILVPLILYLQIYGILLVAAELFDWPEKMRSKSKYLAWLFYLFPKRLAKLILARNHNK
jgi:hypothetical protein